MADQLAIAIDNARQYEELKRTQVQVGSLSALVWMGMASNAWRHTIDKNAQTISEQASLLSKDLAAILSPDKNPHLVKRLTMISAPGNPDQREAYNAAIIHGRGRDFRPGQWLD